MVNYAHTPRRKQFPQRKQLPQAVPIDAIITTVCLSVFARTDSCYFEEIHGRVSRQGGQISDVFLQSCLERKGFTVDTKASPWIVRA